MAVIGSSNDRKGILAISAVAALVGSLCCMTPVVLVLLGLASISVAADMGNVLYGEYRWIFRAFALAFLAVALILYFRKKGICTLDQAKRQRNRILNMSLVVLFFSIGPISHLITSRFTTGVLRWDSPGRSGTRIGRFLHRPSFSALV